MTKRLAIFIHYDPDLIIDDYVIYYLTELKKIASDIIFVSDSDLPKKELKKLDKIVLKSIAYRHAGYDFWCRKLGYQAIEKSIDQYDELIFCNDAIYGPFFPLKDLWKKMNQKECDYWGLFEYFKPDKKIWHIQSYFTVFKKNIFTSKVFKTFMNNIKKEKDKETVIVKYEVGLSDLLRKHNFKYASLLGKSKENLPYTKEGFEYIYKGMPFIKRQLVGNNMCNVDNIYKRRKKLSKKFKENYPWELMEQHLERVCSHCKEKWFYKFGDIKKVILHKKLCRIYCSNKKHYYSFGLKIGGITVLKIPVWFNLNIFKDKKIKGQKTQ